MISIGVDFAAQPAKTAIARITWGAERAEVTAIVTPADDGAIVRSLSDAASVGIDVPFGWPDSFVEFVSDHRDAQQRTATADADEWRRGLAYRLTDRIVAEEVRKQPLSVATDRIALAAMRASSLLATLRDTGEHVDRAGGSRIVEVYPAAALKRWNLPFAGYKGTNTAARNTLIDQLLERAPWLHLGRFDAACRGNDDALDAVIAALVAHAHALGHWTPPAPEQHAQAAREGWMIVPTCPIGALIGS